MTIQHKKSYAIIGTGAIGGFCAVKLQQAGFDVHCLVNRDYDVVKQNGLTLIEDNHPATVHVHVYNNIKTMPKCDVVLITLKSTANHILKDSLSHLLHENSVVCIVQNGIGIEAEIAEFIPADTIVGGSSYVKATKISPGTIKHFGLNHFEWAQYYSDDSHREISPHVHAIAEDFRKTGSKSTALAHLPTLRWKKLISNMATSGLSVALNISLDHFIKNAFSFELLKKLTLEIITAAKICQADIPEDYFEQRLKIFDELKHMNNTNSSMKDDYDAGNPLELHAIYENPLNIAKKHGVSMPLTEMLYLQLRYLVEN